jgi:predicted dithiol-disulfide oxidoreductase (DUF899 family)
MQLAQRALNAFVFADRSQLLVYHFMFGSDWAESCPSCSFLADHFDGAAGRSLSVARGA